MPVDYDAARQSLDEVFAQAEGDLLAATIPTINDQLREAFDVIFQSRTQAYREALLGCTIARIQDKNINIRQPYVGHGVNSFNGRTLDEEVINPFLHEKRIPSSRGPYLSVFRRSVQFDENTRSGVRDKRGYDAFLLLVAHLESLAIDEQLLPFLLYLLYKFAQLRESSEIPISRLQRISLEQYDALISGLLSTPSGGRFPVVLVASTFNAIKEFFNLDWDVSWQGINVADTASGVGGDITIAREGEILMSVEVTERPVDRSRVVATFNTKIAPAGIEDYIFFTRAVDVDAQATQQARQYFAQGHEVNFIEIKNWVLMSLATMGRRGRDAFNAQLVRLLEGSDVPRTVKASWNEQINRVISGSS